MLYLFFEKLQNAAFTNLVHIFKKVVNTFVKDKLITLKVLFKQRKKTSMLQFQQCSVMHLVAHTTNIHVLQRIIIISMLCITRES